MPAFDAQLVFMVLGPLFLLLAAAQRWRRGQWPPQARTWLLLGAIFCAVALWLHWAR